MSAKDEFDTWLQTGRTIRERLEADRDACVARIEQERASLADINDMLREVDRKLGLRPARELPESESDDDLEGARNEELRRVKDELRNGREAWRTNKDERRLPAGAQSGTVVEDRDGLVRVFKRVKMSRDEQRLVPVERIPARRSEPENGARIDASNGSTARPPPALVPVRIEEPPPRTAREAILRALRSAPSTTVRLIEVGKTLGPWTEATLRDAVASVVREKLVVGDRVDGNAKLWRLREAPAVVSSEA